MLGMVTGVARADRVATDLIALYEFTEAKGDTVRDRSRAGTPIDLVIDKPGNVQWRHGALVIQRGVAIRSVERARRLTDAIKQSNALTVEAWVKPANTRQDGPARIVTMSDNTSNRNITLGQDGGKYDARLRSGSTSENGIPSTASPNNSLSTDLTHVVYTRDASGNARIYLNGKQSASKKVGGKLDNWNTRYHLILANELTGDRPWLGEMHLVAIYKKALSPKEVEQNFMAGGGTVITAAMRDTSAKLFEAEVAPILARHCLECHGWKSKKGKLDLSQRNLAQAGGKSGQVILPGSAAKSELFKQVLSNDMPDDRPPLSRREKQLLRHWIDTGAVWSTASIERSAYVKPIEPGGNWLRRLTVTEYIETVRVAVGVDIAEDARATLPRDLRADGFSNTAYNLGVDMAHVEGFAKLARTVAQRMDVPKFAVRFTKQRKFDDATLKPMIAAMGKWLLRGPLEPREIDAYLSVAQAVRKEGGDFDEAVSFIVEAMLQSPRFVYRVEKQRGDGKPQPVTGYELASRLSYILWGGPPDDALLRAAAKGELSTKAQVEAQARRMLRDPRARKHSQQFIYEWLDLGRLDYMRPNAKKFPKWEDALAADMRAETLAFYDEVVWKQARPMNDLFNAQVTIVTPRLAHHYGLTPGTSGGVTRYDLSGLPARGGLLTQGSVLTVGGDEGSMVTRGLFVLHSVLRGHVEDPPPCVDTTPVPTKPGLSQRGVALARLANPACGGCHARFEPLAFGLEKFDGLGVHHEKDHHGNTLRDDGELAIPGRDKPIKYQSSAQLMDLLAASDRVKQTMTWKATQWAIGRPLDESDTAILEDIHKAAQRGGGTYSSLLTAIVTSDLVRKTRTEPQP